MSHSMPRIRISYASRYKAKLNKAMCIAGSAPDTPCTMDSSSFGIRRRLGHDVFKLRLKPTHGDAVASLAAAISICLHIAQYVRMWRHPQTGST